METLLTPLLTLHAAAGFTSLGLFFVPMFARKGSKLHNAVGRWYTYGMWTVVLTALLLCGIRYGQGYYVQALFLGFLALLTSRPLYYGVAILRNKRGPSERMRLIDGLLTAALTVFSPVLLGFGLGWWGPGGHSLLIIFGALGMLITLPNLVKKLWGEQREYNWLEEHISGMLVTAIAGFTAFFAFGGRRIFGEISGNLEIAIWIAPTAIGVLVIHWYKRRMRTKRSVA